MHGTRLGPYLIDRELGSGGMGMVYSAEGPDGVVALKVVHPHLLETPGFFKRFLREAQLGQSIRHENVVRTLDCDQEFSDGKPQCFLVMEYVEGQTLGELLRELERVPEELCRHVAREICKGLAAIHEVGVVHRDLKPENVLITPEHVVKVMDLGVAQVADEALRLSRTGAFVGSVEYAAPEQFKGGDVDGRTDLHALGVLLYELSSGAHPYRTGGFHEAMQRVCEVEPRRLGEMNPQLSAFFEEVVHTLLVKDPRGRFASATQLLDVLHDGEDSAWWHERARKLQAETRRPLRRIRIPRETAVYGRDAELAKLRALYDRAKSGDGQVVLIDGEAGIGKSRLVDELTARLNADGEDFHFLFGSYPPGGAATAEGGFSSAYREHLGEAGSADHLGHLRLLAPAFDALLRGGMPPAGVERLTKDSLQTCFVNVTRALAAERTTVILVDDLHFAPDEGRALFMALALSAPGARVLLLGTTRPGVTEEWTAALTRLDHASQIALQRLGTKDLVQLLQDSFRSKDLAQALGLQIGIKSDGNPFFAFEIIRGLREGQFIARRDDGTWASTRAIEEIQIPSSVLDLVNARAADLSEDERNLLDVAACWGFEFDPLLVGEVLGIARIPLLRKLGQIERRHRLVRAAGVKYVFDHHQVQEALYGSLSELLRREYHAALAETLESRTGAAGKDPETLDGALCVDLCQHYLRGARGESAIRYLPAAQAYLLKGHLNAQMVALTERALAVPGLLAGAERARALLRLCDVLHVVGRRERQEELAREAERLAEDADDDDLWYWASNEVGKALFRALRLDEAEASFQRGLDVAGSSPEREASSLVNLGNVRWMQGRLAEAEDHFERGLAQFRAIGRRDLETNATLNLGNVFQSRGRLAEAQAHFERAIALGEAVGNRQACIAAKGNLGGVLLSLGRTAAAQEQFEGSLRLCREVGYRELEARGTGNLGGVFAVQGRFTEAQSWCERSVALCRELGDRRGEAGGVSSLSKIQRSLGRLAEARELGEREVELTRDGGTQSDRLRAQSELAMTLCEQGERECADERLAACLEQSERLGQHPRRVELSLALGSSRVAAGDVEGGRELLVAARDLARELGLPASEVLARCELACLPDGDADDALAAYTEHEEALVGDVRRRARLLLFEATGDRMHIAEAKRLLDEHLAMSPPAYHESMCRNVRVHREILAAWREELGDDDEPGDAGGTESATRVG